MNLEKLFIICLKKQTFYTHKKLAGEILKKLATYLKTIKKVLFFYQAKDRLICLCSFFKINFFEIPCFVSKESCEP